MIKYLTCEIEVIRRFFPGKKLEPLLCHMSGFSKENRPPVFTYVVVVLPENISIVYKKNSYI